MDAPTPLALAAPFITILVLLLTGAGMRRWGMVTPEGARQMSSLVLNVSLPPLIFITLAAEITPQELGQAPALIVLGIAGTLLGYAVATLLGRLPIFSASDRPTLQAMTALTNTAFIGYPLCRALLGGQGLLYAVLYDVGLTLVMSTLSIWLLSRGGQRGGWQDLARSPMMWALLLGVVWGLCGWSIPAWLRQPLETLGQCTTPLALLTVGMLIRPAPAAKPKSFWRLTALSVARLIITPALIMGLVIMFKVNRVTAIVAILQTAMPTAICTTAMVQQYGGDGELAAAGVVWTTMLSLITLPVWSVSLVR